LVFLLCASCGTGAPVLVSAPASDDDPHGSRATSQERVEQAGEAAAVWRAQRGGAACPTMVVLTADGPLPASYPLFDGWGNDLRIACTESRTRVSSAGPDGRFDDADDVTDDRDVPSPQPLPLYPRAYGDPPPRPVRRTDSTDQATGAALQSAWFRSIVRQCFHAALDTDAGPPLPDYVRLSLSVQSGQEGCPPAVKVRASPDTPEANAIGACVAAHAASRNLGCPPNEVQVSYTLIRQ
jgi:hypothetical protein